MGCPQWGFVLAVDFGFPVRSGGIDELMTQWLSAKLVPPGDTSEWRHGDSICSALVSTIGTIQ